MIHIHIEPEFKEHVSTELLERAAIRTLLHEKADQTTEFSVVIDSDEQLQRLNQNFLGIDAPTDVLSFPSDEFDPDEQANYIGDVIISYPRSVIQAEAADHAVSDELQLLVVHGTLHLLGHDHAEPEEKARMWAAQAEILDSLGCHIKHLPE